MVDYENPRFSLGVSVLLDEMEADFSPAKGEAERAAVESSEELANIGGAPRCYADCFLPQELSKLICDDGDFQASGLPVRSSEFSPPNASRHNLFVEEFDGQGARAFSSGERREEAGASTMHHDEYELRAARARVTQTQETSILAADASIDLSEEMDYQAARALSLQPPEIACAALHNDASVEFDDEYDFQAARALSMQPREVVCGGNDSSIDFDEEFDLQTARELSLQPPELVVGMGRLSAPHLCIEGHAIRMP